MGVEALPLVWCAASNGVLPTGEVGAEGRFKVCRTDQSDDRGVAVVWVPDGGLAAGIQQEHRPAHPPDQGLAGAQASDWLQATDPGITFSGNNAE